MKYDFITIGGATEDVLIFTDEGVLIDNKKDVLKQKLLAFEYGAKVKVNKTFRSFGGGASNAAVALSRLGFNTACLAAVGGDERGKNIINNLKIEKVGINLIQKVEDDVSGFTPIIVDKNGEHVTFSIRGANSRLEISDSLLKKINSTRNIYITSLSEKWQNILKSVFSLKNVKIAWNPGHIQLAAGRQALRKFLAQTNVLILNLDEARELVLSDKAYYKSPLSLFDKVDELLKIINNWGPEIVVITQNEKGASAYDGKKFYFMAAIKNKKALNTVGVGDAFGATFVAGLEFYKGDINKSLELAVKNSASVVRSLGAETGLMTKKQISL